MPILLANTKSFSCHRALFRTVRPAGGGEYSYQDVATAIRADGVAISHTYIWQLRKGLRGQPHQRHLEALARFFGVPAAYFVDDDTAGIDAQLALLAALRDHSVRAIALHAAGLSPVSLQAISGMIDHARAIEAFPPPDLGNQAG